MSKYKNFEAISYEMAYSQFWFLTLWFIYGQNFKLLWPIQIYWKFYNQKRKTFNFQMKNSYFFIIFLLKT